ncbi:MAG: hypothetical protein ABIS92_14325 [Polyangia bacterium]
MKNLLLMIPLLMATTAGSAGAAGTGGAAGMPVGGSGGAAVQHPACDGIGWKTENAFYNTDRVQVPTEYDLQADDAGSVHLVARVSLAGNNATAYLRCLSGGNFEWPMTFVVQGAAATPRVGIEPNGRAHAAWTGSGANDNIYYDVMSDTGGWNVPGTRQFCKRVCGTFSIGQCDAKANASCPAYRHRLTKVRAARVTNTPRFGLNAT